MPQVRLVTDIPIFHKMYDFYQLLHRYHQRIPKSDRYVLWQRCENIALDAMETLIDTGHYFGDERISRLRNFSNKIDLLKVLIRLSHEHRSIDNSQYLSLQNLLQQIGKMIGGWMKQVRM
jgi:hypothetical protein